MKYIIFMFFICIFSYADTKTEYLVSEAKSYLGKKYVWGGTNPNFGADCSGFVQYIYKKQGVALPRTAYAQSKVGQNISVSQLQKGDLLFFLTDKKRGIPVTHVGMYLGNGSFIHAASKDKGVIITPLAAYSKTFVAAKRMTNDIYKVNDVVNFALSIEEQAKRAKTKIALNDNSYIIYNGRYMRMNDLLSQKIEIK